MLYVDNFIIWVMNVFGFQYFFQNLDTEQKSLVSKLTEKDYSFSLDTGYRILS